MADDIAGATGAAGADPKPRAVKKFRLTPPHASEDELHRSVAHMLDWLLLPPAFYTTFPAGWGVLPRATAGRLKACGMKTGLPDIFVFDVGRMIGIELKTRIGRSSADQVEMHEKLAAVNIPVHLCRNLEDVLATLRAENVPMRKHHMDEA